MSNLGDQIRDLKSQGFGPSHIAKSLGCNISSVYYHTNQKTKTRHISRLTNLKKSNKIRGVELLGGKCQKCGYNRCIDALTFHHKNPLEKEIRLGGQPMSWERFNDELQKCVLLCCLCHTELHAGVWTKDELDLLGLVFTPNGHNTGKLILPESKRKRSSTK